VITALNDYRLLLSCVAKGEAGWEKVANGRMRDLWQTKKEPSSALSGTFSHAKTHGRKRQFQKSSLVVTSPLHLNYGVQYA
jgi:hypothetical protein